MAKPISLLQTGFRDSHSHLAAKPLGAMPTATPQRQPSNKTINTNTTYNICYTTCSAYNLLRTLHIVFYKSKPIQIIL